MSGKQPRFFSSILWQAMVLSVWVTNALHGQTTALDFRPLAAEYSLALDRIVMISAGPNQLHIYDPNANTDVTVALANTPLSLSVGPDGLHAAVAYSASVDYIALQSGTIERNYAVVVSGGAYNYLPGKVVLGADYLYVVPGYGGPTSSINLSSGSVSTTSFNYGSGGRYNSATKAIYALQNGLSPNDLNRYDVSGGPIAGVTDSVYHGDFLMCGNVWFSPDEGRIYTGCGTAFKASTDTAKDRRYVGALSGLSTIQAFSESAAIHRIAAVPWATDVLYGSSSLNEGEVRLLDSEYLNQVGHF
jgi:hypothetical protein